MVERTVLKKLLEKYQQRNEECLERYNEDISSLKQGKGNTNYLTDDINSLNTQMSVYECIIKDLKGLVE